MSRLVKSDLIAFIRRRSFVFDLPKQILELNTPAHRMAKSKGSFPASYSESPTFVCQPRSRTCFVFAQSSDKNSQTVALITLRSLPSPFQSNVHWSLNIRRNVSKATASLNKL